MPVQAAPQKGPSLGRKKPRARLVPVNYISQTAMGEIAGGDWGNRLRTILPALDYTSRHDARGVASCRPKAS